mmetsp:Transcript_36696/g.116796  ORF Transcript_36696/g.116796 Transcript_36696/m.116796 type:complete len:265 (+) Transcript_36696:3474-4268(+)
MAFSTERVSSGRPNMPHSRMVTGSPSTLPTVGLSAQSMPRPFTLATHARLSLERYGAVNGPWNAIAPEHTTILPMRLRWPSWSDLHSPSQRIFSEPSPPTSLAARSSLICVSFSCSSSSRALDCVSSSLRLRPATRDSTSASMICFSFSIVSASSSFALAAASFSFLGSTVLATRSYVSMARTHKHSDRAALDTLPTVSGWKLSFLTYFWMALIFLVSMLSLSKSCSDCKKPMSDMSFFDSSHDGFLPRRMQTASSTICTSSGG